MPRLYLLQSFTGFREATLRQTHTGRPISTAMLARTGRLDPGKAGYGWNVFAWRWGEVWILPLDERGLRTEVLEGAGDGIKGYAMI